MRGVGHGRARPYSVSRLILLVGQSLVQLRGGVRSRRLLQSRMRSGSIERAKVACLERIAFFGVFELRSLRQ